MFRRRLAPDAGMLFLFPPGDRPTMWMVDTWLPLDMLFVNAEGRIVHIVPNTVPRSRLTISSPKPASMVLELRGGTARRLGLATGDRLVWRRLDRRPRPKPHRLRGRRPASRAGKSAPG